MLTKSELKEKKGALEALRVKAAEAWAQAGDEIDMDKVTVIDGDSSAKAAQLKTWNDEMTELAKEIEPAEEFHGMKQRVADLDDVEDHPGHAGAGGQTKNRQTKSVGELFVESDALKSWKPGPSDGPAAELEFEIDDLKTLFQTSAGWAPFSPRGPRVVEYATRPVEVIDLFPMGETTFTSIVYMEETTFTNNAAETAEGAAKPEAALALTERTEPVRKIAVTLPVTDEQLEDVPRVRSYIDNRLGFMVRQRLDGQLLVGDGTAPNISGILDRSGIQTQALGADPVPDAIYKAMTKIRVNAFAVASGVVLHPNDWQGIRLLRTADGIYIWGNPSEAGPERIWGLPVAQSTALTENTGLVGDFRQSEVVMRKGLTVQIGWVNDDFTKNRQTFRAELRAALAVYRPAAFCSVTGI